jgi:hypothetical protein
MKRTDIKVGVVYIGRSVGQTRRKVLGIDHVHRHRVTAKDVVLFQQDGRNRTAFMDTFARWAKGVAP